MPAQQAYMTGTAKTVSGSTIVLGTGTSWALSLVNGGLFTQKGVAIPIVSVEANTSLTLAYPWPAASFTGTYAIELGRAEAASAIEANKQLSEMLSKLNVVSGSVSLAEDAAKIVQASAGIFGTVAAGLAATTNGKVFGVPSGNDPESIRLYLNNNGAAADTGKSLPSAALFEAMKALAQATEDDRERAEAAALNLDGVATAVQHIDAIREAPEHAARAETAADLAQVLAGIYGTTAAGLAATTNGKVFGVVSASDPESVRLYLNNAGAAVDTGKSMPSSAAVATIANRFLGISPKDVALAFVDDVGLACLIVTAAGATRVLRLSAAEQITAPSIGTDTAKMVTAVPYGYAWSLLDGDDFMALGVRNDGTTVARKLDGVATINGIPIESYRAGVGGSTALTPPRFIAEIVHLISYGQSLSNGTDAVPALTTASAYDNLRFAGGVRTGDSATPYTSFVPLTETTNSPWGETPISGAADAIKQLIFSENSLALTDYTYQLLGSAPGAGGTAIAGLMPGTGPFTRMMADVQAGKDLAQAAGKLFKVGTMFWTQAESDYIGSTPAETYKQRFRDLVSGLNTQAKAITGQPEDVEVIGYQVQGHATYGFPQNPYLAAAQLELSEELARYHIACPLYWSAQTVHQSALNSRRLGAYYGLCHKRVSVDQKTWKPLSPVQISKQGNIILARFNVPSGSLVFDTAIVPPCPNMGFRVVDGVGADIAINSVTIAGPDTVKIVCAAPVANSRLRYGFTAGRGGNLRDRQGEKIIFDPTTNPFPMHNWCVIFDKA